MQFEISNGLERRKCVLDPLLNLPPEQQAAPQVIPKFSVHLYRVTRSREPHPLLHPLARTCGAATCASYDKANSRTRRHTKNHIGECRRRAPAACARDVCSMTFAGMNFWPSSVRAPPALRRPPSRSTVCGGLALVTRMQDFPVEAGKSAES